MDISTFAVGDDPICRVSIAGELFAHREAREVAKRILELADKAELITLERIRSLYDN